MQSPTDLVNFSLLALGNAAEIQNIETDTSKEARVARRLYWTLLKSLLGSYAWNWATVFQKLSLLSTYPTPEWPFQYAYPNNCLKMIRIWNHRHTDDLENSIKYIKANNGTQSVILTDYGPTSILAGTPWDPIQPTLPLSGNTWPIPVAQFVAYTDNFQLMPEMFKTAFGFILAAYMAPSIPGIGQTDLREKNLQLGNAALSQAASQDQNESRPPVELRSLIERASNGEWVPAHGTFQAFPNNFPT